MQKWFLTMCCLLIMGACQAQEKQDKKVDRQDDQSQGKHVGGPCEGCEAIYEWGDKQLSSIDTLPDFRASGPRLKISGTVYKRDGKTPAPDVILYIYHTNQEGTYPTKGGEQGWARRHGYLRGWVKTGADGRYTFYTIKPGHYPGRTEPAHIHLTVKEPDKNDYYLDDYVFKGDPLLNKTDLNRPPRGSSGLMDLKKEGNLWVANRDIILGLNIPDYE